MKNITLFSSLFLLLFLSNTAFAQDQPPHYSSGGFTAGDTWVSFTGAFSQTSGVPITISVSYEPESQPVVQDTVLDVSGLSYSITVDGLQSDTYYTFYFVYTNAYGQQTKSFSFFTTTVGITEVKQAELKLFPNPMTSDLFIENAEVNDLLTISDMIGKQVYSEKIRDNKQQRISVGELTAGIYFVTVGDKTTRVQKK